MYAWLTDGLTDDGSHVVTANRRLARVLNGVYAERQVAAGREAWRRPVIVPAAAWYRVLAGALTARANRPIRIAPQHARLVFEQCLLEDLDATALNLASLARQCHEIWNRLQDWCVPLDECQAAANGQDQRIFARAAGRYRDRLENEGWIDDAMFRRALPGWIVEDGAEVPASVTLAGFDRITPALAELIATLEQAGTVVREVDAAHAGGRQLRVYPNPEAELRAAGAWAREQLEEHPGARVAVVVNELEQHGERAGRLLRETMTPGWQYASASVHDAVNVSYGRRLADYPAIAIALLALRWLSDALDGERVSLLLRSPLIGHGDLAARGRLELRLRDLPDRAWSTALVFDAFDRHAETDGGGAWISAWRTQVEVIDGMPQRQGARRWAEAFDAVLGRLGWPGTQPQGSADFQLENRWREQLSEFASLDAVAGAMTLRQAVARLATMCSEALFQPESATPVVNVLGPLEAAGLEFDALWITGLTAADWPPHGRPSPLVSTELQRRYELPDATPEDTVSRATRVLDRLLSSARTTIVSYPRTVGDAEQMPTAAIADDTVEGPASEPGWHAATMIGTRMLVDTPDPVPSVVAGERVTGGASIINLQTSAPFDAFAAGRLATRPLRPYQGGIRPDTRGNLIHDALELLYDEGLSRADIAGWDEAQRAARIGTAVDGALARLRWLSDRTLGALLDLERLRTVGLLNRVVEIDLDRDAFVIDGIEKTLRPSFDVLELELRADRVDRLEDGSLVVLDYKSSRSQTFLKSGKPNDLQLVVYATAMHEPLSGLGLYRVDSAQVEIDGCGPAIGETADWPETLADWKALVYDAAEAFVRGDVRLNAHAKSQDVRALNLMSRFTELKRGR